MAHLLSPFTSLYTPNPWNAKGKYGGFPMGFSEKTKRKLGVDKTERSF
jgi:hypothetical protein